MQLKSPRLLENVLHVGSVEKPPLRERKNSSRKKTLRIPRKLKRQLRSNLLLNRKKLRKKLVPQRKKSKGRWRKKRDALKRQVWYLTLCPSKALSPTVRSRKVRNKSAKKLLTLLKSLSVGEERYDPSPRKYEITSVR